MDKRFASIMLTLAMVSSSFLVAGCAASPKEENENIKPSSTKQESSDWNGNEIAASMDGYQITEQNVADYISQYRKYARAEEDKDWATLLDESGKTIEDIRKEAIMTIAEHQAVYEQAELKGISIDETEISSYIEAMKEELGYSDDSSWNSLLEATGYDNKQGYEDDVRFKLLAEKLISEENPNIRPTDAQMQLQANSSTTSYTGKKIDAVVFPMNSGISARRFIESFSEETSISPEDFKKRSEEEIDAGKANEFLELGWTCLNDDISSNITNEAKERHPGDVFMASDDNGSYLACYIVEEYRVNTNGVMDLSVMPQEITAKLRSDVANRNMDKAYSDYLKSLITDKNLVINDMPQDAPYDVDMKLSEYAAADNSEEEMQKLTDEQISAMEEQ